MQWAYENLWGTGLQNRFKVHRKGAVGMVRKKTEPWMLNTKKAQGPYFERQPGKNQKENY